MRTRDMMYSQTIRTVRDISRDDRARIANCSLRTPTDRQTDRLNEKCSIDMDETILPVIGNITIDIEKH